MANDNQPRYLIQESVRNNRIETIKTLEDVEPHHPSDFNRDDPTAFPNVGSRAYAVINGRAEEVNKNNNDLLVKDIIFSNSGNYQVDIPSPIAGYVKTSTVNGTVAIYDAPGDGGKLIGRVLHMDRFNVKNGEYIEYGQPLGRQGGIGADGTKRYGTHGHIEVSVEQMRKYIADVDKGIIAPGIWPSPDPLKNLEEEISTKFDRINTLNAKLEALDKTTQANEIAKVEADIQAERATLAQLELDRQQEIDRQQAALAEDKESIVGEMVLGALKVGVLTELKAQLGGLSNSSEDLKKAESLFKESGLALSTPAEATLADKGSLDLTNKEDVTALQNVLYERGLIESKVRGNFLSQTQGGLRTALGLPDDHQFGASLSAEEVNQLTQLSMEMLQTRVNTELENEKSAQAVSETKKTEIDTKISELDNHRPDIYEQKIANQPSHDQIHELQGQQIQHLQDQIALKEQVQAALQKDIDRNDQRINEVEGLQASLYARTDVDPEKPVYTQIKADLEKADVQLSLGAEKDAFYVSINTKDKTQATALQDYLIEHKYLDPKYLNSKGVERDANDGDFGNRSKTALNKALEGSDVPKPYINDKGEVSKEALTALRDKELDGLTKEQLVTKIDAYKTELEADNKALISEKAEIVQGVKQLEDRVADKVAVREVQKESERASIQLTDPTKSSLMMEGDRPILMVAGKSYDLSEFNEVKGMNLFRSRDNSLIGRINDEGSLEVFQKVSSGSAVKLAEIENIKEQNMVTLNEASLSHSRALSQSRDQDQGRSIE